MAESLYPSQEPPVENYVLRLYVAGNTRRSNQAVLAMRHICDEHLAGRHQLDVVDIYKNPRATREDQVIAIPTLVKCEPLPLRKLVGDFSREDRILSGLGLDPS